jgi:hypothetical protein
MARKRVSAVARKATGGPAPHVPLDQGPADDLVEVEVKAVGQREEFVERKDPNQDVRTSIYTFRSDHF